jgi:hypothetical protein
MIGNLAPTFLKGPWGQKFLYAPGVVLDGITEWMLEGLIARYPTVGTPTAYPYIAHDRGIALGFEEPAASQEARLVRAVDDKRTSGHPHTLLRQLEGYMFGRATQIAIVTSVRGTWHVLRDGVITDSKLVGNWDWEGETAEEWSRFWVVIWPLGSEIWEADGELGDDGPTLADDGLTLGTTATAAQVESIREIVRAWKPRGRRCVNIIIALDPDTFPPLGAPGTDGLPTGHNRHWAEDDGVGVLREIREPSARYWDGSSRRTVEIDL